MLKRSVSTKALIRLSNRKLWISVILILLSLGMPFFINYTNLGIYESLFRSIENNDQGLLLITSFKLVLMNAVRSLPIFMASFMFIETLKEFFPNRMPKAAIVLGLLLVPAQYLLVDLLLQIHYDFGVTSIVIMMAILFMANTDLSRISIWKKAVFVILFLIGLQWCDIIPSLSPYGFGRGEVSFDIKLASQVMGANESLDFSAAIFSLFFLINAFMILKFLKDQNLAVQAVEMRTHMEMEMRDVEMRALRTRSLEEMQNLVHDLKSPLTSIQALVSLSEMLAENEKVKEYMNKIGGSVDQLSGMITEILDEAKRQRIDIEALFDSALSQLSPLIGSAKVDFRNDLPYGTIEVNKIRFSRMLTNLLSNSIAAFDKEEDKISIRIYERETRLIMEIVDNGRGIEAENLMRIKERGFSTRGSSGIGLRYVEDVVRNHGGRAHFESTVGVGTRVRIEFEKEEIRYEEDFGD